MKKILLILTLAAGLTSIQSYAQDTTQTLFNKESTRTLFSRERIKYIGLYGDFNFQYGQIKNSFTPIGGASIMVLLNKKFGIGATIQKNISDNFSPSGVSPLYLNSSFGGLKLEYIANPNGIVHLTFPLIVGMGFARVDSVTRDFKGPFDHNNHDFDNGPGPGPRGFGHTNDNTSRFFIVQPGVQAEVNLVKCVKLYAGVNYRFSFMNDNRANLPSNTLQGFSAVVGIKAGIFEMPTKRKPKPPVEPETKTEETK